MHSLPRAILHNLQSDNTTPPTALLPQSVLLDVRRQAREWKEGANSSRRLRSRARIVPAGGRGVGGCTHTVELSDWLCRRWNHFEWLWETCSWKAQGSKCWREKPPSVIRNLQISDIWHQKLFYIKGDFVVKCSWFKYNLSLNPSNYIVCSLLCFNVLSLWMSSERKEEP